MKTTTKPPTKWAELVSRLVENGMSMAEIARECESSASTIGSLRHGLSQEPGHSLGEKLLALDRKRARKGTH